MLSAIASIKIEIVSSWFFIIWSFAAINCSNVEDGAGVVCLSGGGSWTFGGKSHEGRRTLLSFGLGHLGGGTMRFLVGGFGLGVHPSGGGHSTGGGRSMLRLSSRNCVVWEWVRQWSSSQSSALCFQRNWDENEN